MSIFDRLREGLSKTTRQIVQRFDGTAAPPHQRREARQPQCGDRVVEIARREAGDRDGGLGHAGHGRRVLSLGDENGPHAAHFAEMLERLRGIDQPIRFADDDDGRGEGACRPALAVPAVANDARQGGFDLRERDVLPVGQEARVHLGVARGHRVLQRRPPSAAIILSASVGPHSPASYVAQGRAGARRFVDRRDQARRFDEVVRAKRRVAERRRAAASVGPRRHAEGAP